LFFCNALPTPSLLWVILSFLGFPPHRFSLHPCSSLLERILFFSLLPVVFSVLSPFFCGPSPPWGLFPPPPPKGLCLRIHKKAKFGIHRHTLISLYVPSNPAFFPSCRGVFSYPRKVCPRGGPHFFFPQKLLPLDRPFPEFLPRFFYHHPLRTWCETLRS